MPITFPVEEPTFLKIEIFLYTTIEYESFLKRSIWPIDITGTTTPC